MKPCPHPLHSVLPHASPMILLDAIDGYDDEEIRTHVRVSDETPFMHNGQVPSYVGIEYMAQSIAAFQGLIALESRKPVKVGFLLGTRKLTLACTSFDVADLLNIEAKLLYSDGQVGSFDCRIVRGDDVVSTARLTVYEVQDDLNNPKDNG